MLTLLISTAVILTAALLIVGLLQKQQTSNQQQDIKRLTELATAQLEATRQLQQQRDDLNQVLKHQQQDAQHQRERFDQHQVNSLKTLQDSIGKAMQDVRAQIAAALTQHAEQLNQQMDKLTRETKTQLQIISGEVHKQLNAGFEKTTSTFNDVLKRLTIIDQAQQKITELSSNVVDLQSILSDKKSRGAFGEVQLSGLIRNMIPESNFALQHTLSNDKRADCILFLPEPTGNIVIDAKFPLETYRELCETNSAAAHKKLSTQFKQDIKKHIQDIASKYIIPGETADGAMMFIPAEAIFAEIHANYADLVEYAHQQRIWLVSPTTMMAILTTARAVLKDAATRKQVHIIQEHLVALSKDFGRFQSRMDNLSRHISQAQQDVEQVHRSSQKITSRFAKIEKVEVLADESEALLIEAEEG